MAKKDVIVRLKKFPSEGGQYLDWVIYPETNTGLMPSYIHAFDSSVEYPRGQYVVKDEIVYFNEFKVPAGTWDPTKWASVSGRDAYVGQFKPDFDYKADSIIYENNAEQTIWYTKTGLAGALTFDKALWTRINTHAVIETAVIYSDPDSTTEKPSIVRASFIEVEREELDLSTMFGAYFDPAKRYTLFQDGSATIPVNAVGQTVKHIKSVDGKFGLIEDPATDNFIYEEDKFGHGYLRCLGKGSVLEYASDTPTGDFYLGIPNLGAIKTDVRFIGVGYKGTIGKIGVTSDASAASFLTAQQFRYEDHIQSDLINLFNGITGKAEPEVNCDFSQIMSAERLFRGYGNVVLPAAWNDVDLSHVTNADAMLENAKATTVNLNKWTFEELTSVARFMRSSDIHTLDLTAATFKQVTNFSSFAENSKLTTLTMPKINLGNVKDASFAFNGANDFDFDLSKVFWNEMTTADGIIGGGKGFTSTIVLNADKLLSASGAFRGYAGDQDIEVKAQNLSNASSMFEAMTATAVDITITAGALKDMSKFLKDSTVFSGKLTISATDMVENLDHAFFGAAAFTITAPFISPLKVKTMEQCFEGANLVTAYPFTGGDFPSLTNAERAFYGTAIPFEGQNLVFPVLGEASFMFGGLRRPDFATTAIFHRLILADSLFSGAEFTGFSTNLTMTRAIKVSRLFSVCLTLASVTGIISLPKATTVSEMFRGNTVLNSEINLVAPKVNSLESMFRDCVALNTEQRFSVPELINVTAMFSGASAYDQALGFINPKQIQRDRFEDFLKGNMVFDQDLSAWCVEHIKTPPSDAFTSTLIVGTAKEPSWGTAC